MNALTITHRFHCKYYLFPQYFSACNKYLICLYTTTHTEFGHLNYQYLNSDILLFFDNLTVQYFF